MNSYYRIRYILFFLITAASVYLSIHFSSKYFKLDADTINSALVWGEIRNNGIDAIKSWIPTEDNWYLSVYPIHFIIYAFFGWTSIHTLIAISSAQVLACAFLSFLIVRRISNGAYSILIMPALCSLPYFCYAIGFISHPFSHNTSNLYGLLLIYININTNKRLYRSLFSCVIILIAAVSDPWLMAAYGLPVMLHSLVVDIKQKQNRFMPSLFLFLSLIIYFSQFIQKCLGVPVAHFHIADFTVIKSNIYWYIYSIGGMVNMSYHDSDVYKLISFLIFITLGTYGILRLYSSGRKEVSFLMMMSVAGISGAYILGLPEKQYYSARFLVNVIYIYYIISFFMIALDRKIRCFYFIAVIFVSISSIIGHVRNSSDNLVLAAEQQLRFMEENNLKYGFGPYWSGNPNVVTWLSKSDIDFNPIIFRADDGYMDWATPHAQSFRDNIKPKKKSTFIMISSDGESCKDIDICIRGVKEQYGNPDKIIRYHDSFFYVYDNGLKHVN